jgi:2-polyprenyl-6-methoxyphenol hydroxylase-like FAD-dependent oxidoreductase
MNTLLGQRAVVIGAGIGGLSAAGALAAHFTQVDVLERDYLPASVGSRPGTPQDRHPHGLLAGGLRALEEIFPGFAQDLASAGAVPVGYAQDVLFERADVGTLPRRDLGIGILCATRPLIEFVLRKRVAAIANVAIRPRCRVASLLPAKSGAGVRGVRLDAVSGATETLEADLVVDASGRGEPTLAVLDALGLEQPPVTEVGVDLGYTTAVVAAPADAATGRTLVLTQPDPPALALHSVLVPAEDNQWTVLIANHGPAARARDWHGFLETARRLITPTIYQMLRYADPPTSLRYYGFPASRWRHFECLPCLPRGVLPVADSLCRFNPIYGQGMSAAAQQARLLQRVLGQVAAETDPLAAVQTEFMAQVASVLHTPWAMSTSADLAFPQTRGQRPDDFAEARRFEAALFRAAVADPIVHRAMMQVAQLLRPFSHLQEPDIRERIDAAALESAT